MMLTRTSKTLAATVAIAGLLALPLAAPAQARDGWHHHGSSTGAYVGLGLGALALGSALAYSATGPHYYYYAPPAYYAPPPVYYAPPPVYYYPPY